MYRYDYVIEMRLCKKRDKMGLRTSVGEGGDLQCRTVSALINRVVNIGKQELWLLVIFLKELAR